VSGNVLGLPDVDRPPPRLVDRWSELPRETTQPLIHICTSSLILVSGITARPA
jgi:hypothetical protein